MKSSAITRFLLYGVAAMACGLGSCLSTSREQADSPPNFIFIFTDDQRFDMAHALGDKSLITPNLDRLVKEGTTFTHAYNMGAWHGAVCVASRSMLLSGRSVWNARAAEDRFDEYAKQGAFWPQALERAGYETYMSGKWHIKADPADVFRHVRHVRPGMPNQTPAGYNRPLNPTDTAWQPWDHTFEGFWKGGKHWSEVLADDGVEYISQAKEQDKPFFMYLAFNAPHDPRQSPREYVEKYPVDKIALPPSYLDLYPYQDSIGLGPSLRDEALAPFPRTPFAVKKHIQEYNAIVSHLDSQIGRLLDALEKSGKKDNTYILFTSDHGLAVGRHGLMGKQNMFDHSMRVPLVIVGPGIPKGKRLSQQVYLQDVAATILDLAALEKTPEMEFNSLMPYLTGTENTPSAYGAIYGCYMNLQRMVRTEEYKLIVYPKASKALLFDMKKDSHEMNDLSEEPAYREIKGELLKQLGQLQQQFNDPLDLDLDQYLE